MTISEWVESRQTQRKLAQQRMQLAKRIALTVVAGTMLLGLAATLTQIARANNAHMATQSCPYPVSP